LEKISLFYKKTADFFDKIVYIIGGTGLLTCVGMCGANILMWWFAGRRIAVNDEISLFGLIWATYIGMGILYRVNGHCTMDFIVKAMPPKAQRVIRILNNIVIIAVCILTIHYSWQLALKSFTKKLVLTKIPYFYVDISITIGYAHLMFLAIGDTVANVYRMVCRRKEQ